MLEKIQQWWRRGLLLWLGLSAFVWRIVCLGKADLWGDEILYARRSSPPANPVDIFRSHMEVFPALPYLPLPSIIQNMFLWVARLFSDDVLHSAFAQRFPAAVFGALAAPLVYLLIRTISNHRVALLTALMHCFFYVPLYFGREARFYAPLQLFIVVLYLLYFRVLTHRHCTLKYGGGIVLSGTMVCHMTLNGILYVGGLMGVSMLSLVFGWRPAGTELPEWRRLHILLLVLLGVAALTFLPLLIPFLTEGTALRTEGLPSLWIVLHDLFGRMLMGTTTAGWWLSALMLACGLFFIVRGRENRYFQHAFLLSMTAVFVLTFLNVVRSEYYFLRLFFGQIIAVYWVAAAGLVGLLLQTTRKSPRDSKTRIWCYRLCAAAMLGIHALVFAPQFWLLNAKSSDYGGVARWLNENLEPGTPYVLESCYQLRFISGHYETPGLVAVCAYLHGPEDGEIDRLRERQRDFLMRFPEAYYVESAFHDPPWDWPDEHFAHCVTLENEPLQRLVEWGIHDKSYSKHPAVQHGISIYYNTPEDVRRLLKEEGQSVYFEYPEWHCVAYAQYQYGRFTQGKKGIIRVLNMEDRPVTGRFAIEGAVIASSQREHLIGFDWEQGELFRIKMQTGRIWTEQTPPVDLPPGWSEFKLEAPDLQSGQNEGLLLLDIQFERSVKR